MSKYIPIRQIAGEREVAGLDNGRLTLAPVGYTVEFIKIVYNNRPVAAGLVVYVRVVLV